MLPSTLKLLVCPKRKKNLKCGGALRLSGGSHPVDVLEGELTCVLCQMKYPILGGVAIVVPHVRQYLLSHVKGISQVVADSKIPREYLKDYLKAKTEMQSQIYDEDLEAERVNALYLMNHYLRVRDLKPTQGKSWWSSVEGMSSPLLEKLIREFWDHGPFEKIGHWMKELSTQNLVIENALELGCGVGGLARVLKPYLKKYLGVDSSFASIALARHLNLGAPGPRGSIKIPEDLLKGWVSRPVYLEPAAPTKGVDFIVGDLNHLPLQESSFDLALDLNVIDMLDEPSLFPKLKNLLLKKNGVAVQSSPYVWSEKASNHLKKRLPPKLRDSALAVLHLYEQAGFKILKNDEHLPWLFFKNVRQLEIYSVHLFLARKSS